MKTSVLLLLIVLCCVLFLSDTAFSQGAGKKTTVAVLEFQSGGTLDKQEAYTLTNRFRALLVKTQAFQLIERDKMNDILKEQDFIISDNCNTSECVVQVGQLLGVESMIAGDIGKLGETYTIDLRMIDIQTGALTYSQSKNHKGKLDELLDVLQLVADELVKVSRGHSVVKKFNLTVTALLPKSVSDKKAEIKIDGVSKGFNSVKVTLPEGPHKIEVGLNDDNFTTFSKDLTLKSDEKIEAKIDYSETYKLRQADLLKKQKEDKEKAARDKQAAKELAEKQKKALEKPPTGGPYNAFLSALVPGLGGHFVEKGKIRPIMTSVTAIGLIGYGLMQKSTSSDYYSDYKKSNISSEKPSLYKKANDAHHNYYIATRIGAAIWIADIIWVAYKGMQNRKQTKTTSFSFPNNGLRLMTDGNNVQLGYSVSF